MAIVPKQPKGQKPKSPQHIPTAGEERQSTSRSIEDTKNRIMSWPNNPPPQPAEGDVIPPDPDVISSGTPPIDPDALAPKPKLTPVGSGDKRDDDKGKPPEAKIGAEPPKPGEVLTQEQLEEQLGSVQVRPGSALEKPMSVVREAARAQHKVATEQKDRADKLEKELEELRGKALPEEELGRLRSIEHDYSLRNVRSLPKWKEYDKAVEKINADAGDLLLSFRETPEQKEALKKTLEAIAKRGGLVEFSESKKLTGKKLGEKELTEAEFFKHFIYDRLDNRQQRQFDALTVQAFTKLREKETALQEAEANAQETLKTEGTKAQQQFLSEADEAVRKFLASELPKFDFPTSRPEVSQTDPAEVKATKERQQKLWDETQKDLRSELKTAEDYGTLKVRAALYSVIVDQYLGVKKELAAVIKERDQLQEYKDNIKTARRVGRGSLTQPAGDGGKAKEYSHMSTTEALGASGFPVNTP